MWLPIARTDTSGFTSCVTTEAARASRSDTRSGGVALVCLKIGDLGTGAVISKAVTGETHGTETDTRDEPTDIAIESGDGRNDVSYLSVVSTKIGRLEPKATFYQV